jgi:hypothetical protein
LLKTSTILIAGILLITITATAGAQHRHHRRDRTIDAPIVCNRFGCSDRPNTDRVRSPHVLDANGNSVVLGRRPAGCPHAFCGCEASLYLFGKIRPDLNLASNWIRKFPRTAPAPGMAAARSHHVMVLISHVDGSNWLVHDGNSGDGLTRDHVRSINGYTIVDPQRSRFVKQEQ